MLPMLEIRNGPGGRKWAAGPGTLMLVALLCAGFQSASATAKPAASADPHKAILEATIRRGTYGVPHVLAKNYAGLGFGYGYATAQDSACVLSDRWLTVSATRASTLGPGKDDVNILSDFFWQYIIDEDVVGKALRAGADAIPPHLRDLVRGYAAGYNHYLEKVHDQLHDPDCPDSRLIRPITERDVYHQALYLSLLLGVMSERGGYLDIAGAAPPTANRSADVLRPHGLPSDFPRQLPASNMAALGSEATDNARGMMFTNPHWSWEGPNRFSEAHLTIPGRINVYGSSIIGIPVITFGNNEHVAWSHTVSTPRVVLTYRLALGSRPTTYRVDGRELPMQAHRVRIRVRTDHGLSTRTGTVWRTRFGLVFANAGHPWTKDHAYALHAKDMNLRWLVQDLGYATARSVAEVYDIAAKTLGWGWFNTGVADDQGHVALGPMQSVPLLTDRQLADCAVGPGGSDAILDGSRSVCEVGTDPTAPVPGLYPLKALPVLFRKDYVANSNGSPWATNPRQLLEGYPRIVGPERTMVSLRTRVGLQIYENRLAGRDGLPGNRFTLDELIHLTMDDRVLTGQLWRDELVGLCHKAPVLEHDQSACDALAGWKLTFDEDDPGAVLFRVFAEHLNLGQFAPPSPDLFSVPFDYHDPIHTPRGLNTDNPRVLQALVDAIKALKETHVPMNATLRNYQYALKGHEHIPLPGGSGGMGVYNFIRTDPDWQPGVGWKDVQSGSTYISWVQFTDQGVVGKAILTHSLSTNPDSPNYANQTWLFSRKEFKPMRLYEKDVLADPHLEVTHISSRR